MPSDTLSNVPAISSRQNAGENNTYVTRQHPLARKFGGISYVHRYREEIPEADGRSLARARRVPDVSGVEP